MNQYESILIYPIYRKLIYKQNKLLEKMQGYNNCDHIYSFGEDNTSGCLWLGDYNSAKNKKVHRQKSIQTVITAGLGMKLAISDPIRHRLYPLYDSPVQNIEKFFDQAFEHIEEGLKNGNVLVHCFAGVSRSSTIVISYLMKKMNWSFKEAHDYVRKKRWVVNPNPGFIRQLKRYETRLKTPFNNPESPEKMESSYVSKTPKYTQKSFTGPKTYGSMFMAKSNVDRGKSLYGKKTEPRVVNMSMSKR